MSKRRGDCQVATELVEVFHRNLGHSHFTPVQQRTIDALLSLKDVIVQSPTGSGKTIAYLLPSITLMLNRRRQWTEHEIGIVILVPNRELAHQIFSVAQPFVHAVSLKLATLVGGSKEAQNLNGANLIIATPGRFEQVLKEKPELRIALKNLEVLVFDEADRFSDANFKKSAANILSAMPKQRRTALFSATQAKSLEEMVMFGLRNPHRITLTDGEDDRDWQQGDLVTPNTLLNQIAIVEAEKKFALLIDLLEKNRKVKALVFLCSSQVVEYFARILPRLLKRPEKSVLAIHGKKKNREKRLEQFRSSSNAILLCTDVMSRGIDLPDVDLVLQFDIPKISSWFVHRAGRTGRQGRFGRAILLLSTEQEPYVKFIDSYEKVKMERIDLSVDAQRVEEVRLSIIQLANGDRAILESGTRAFVSFIQSYTKHDCQLVCPLRELDLVGYGHSYGLLRLPRMPELNGRDLTGFKRSDIDTSSIAFNDKSREKIRQQRRSQRQIPIVLEERQESIEIPQWIHPKVAKKRRRREMATEKKDWDEMADDLRLMKKLKKGRLSKEERGTE